MELAAVVLDNVTGARDRMSWGGSKHGSFTVSSAYEMLTYDDTPRQHWGSFFDRIWRVRVSERVRTFLWLVGNQIIMTNEERKRRHLSDTDICQVCKGGIKTILHILRDCPAMSGIWHRLVPSRKQRVFFTMTLFEWLYANLQDETRIEEGPWSTIFAISVWWGWKWRCENIFGENKKCRDRVRFLKDWAKEVNLANSPEEGLARGRARVERMVGWMAPCWVKVNTDGASHGNPGLATAGGVIRDSEGKWCGGFALNIGRCSAPLAELWGVYYGLYLAWEQRVLRVEVEVDSEIVVEFLKTGIGDHHPLSFLVRLCHGFLSKD